MQEQAGLFFDLKYREDYKVITYNEGSTDITYILYACGTEKPDDEFTQALAANTTAYIEIPVTAVVTSDSTAAWMLVRPPCRHRNIITPLLPYACLDTKHLIATSHDPVVVSLGSAGFPMGNMDMQHGHATWTCVTSPELICWVLQEELGVEDRVRYASSFSTAPCMMKLALPEEQDGCGRDFSTDYDTGENNVNVTQYDVEFAFGSADPAAAKEGKQIVFRYCTLLPAVA